MKPTRGLAYILLVISLVLLLATPVAADKKEPLSIIGHDYVVQADTIINKDIVVMGGDFTMEPNSQVNGQITVTGGDAVIAGTVNGNIVVIGGHVQLTSSATVNGDIISSGQVTRAEGAVLNGQLVSGLGAAFDSRFTNRLLPMGQVASTLSGIVKTLGSILILGLFIVLNVLVYYLATPNVQKMEETIRASWLRCLGSGLLTLLVGIVILPLLVIICIGIPLAIVLAVVLIAIFLIGSTALNLLIGQQIVTWLKTSASPLVEVACGAAIEGAIFFIPWLGTAVLIIGGAIGIGAALLTHLGTRQHPWPLD